MADCERDFFICESALEAGRTADALAFGKMWARSVLGPVCLGQVKTFGKAFRTHMAATRKSWEVLKKLWDASKGDLLTLYKGKIEREMDTCGSEFSTLLESTLLAKTTDTETKAYIWKLIADSWRYIAEVSLEEAHSKAAESALDGYLKASAIALELQPCSPVRLAVAINFSVFYFDILDNPARAFKLSRSAYDSAVSALPALPDPQRPEAEDALSILTENLNVWASSQTSN